MQVGDLHFAGNGTRLSPQASLSVGELEAKAPETNLKMLERLRADRQAEFLLQACHDDAARGRMTEPRVIGLGDLANGSFSPRFGVAQSALSLGAFIGSAYTAFVACRKARRFYEDAAYRRYVGVAREWGNLCAREAGVRRLG